MFKLDIKVNVFSGRLEGDTVGDTTLFQLPEFQGCHTCTEENPVIDIMDPGSF